MKLKTKQISLGALAAITMITIPVATVISCGSKSNEGNTSGNTSGTNSINTAKITLADKVLETKPTKDMVFNVDAKTRTPVEISKAVSYIFLGARVSKGSAILTKMDSKSKSSFPMTAFEQKGPSIDMNKIADATDDDLMKMSKTQKEFETNLLTEHLTIKSLVFKFSDGKVFKFTPTLEERKKLKDVVRKDLDALANAFSMEFLKENRSLEKANRSNNQVEAKKSDAKIKKINDKSSKIFQDISLISDSLKKEFAKRIASTLK